MAPRIISKSEWPTWAVERFGDRENFFLVDCGEARFLPMANFDEDEVVQYAEEFLARRQQEELEADRA